MADFKPADIEGLSGDELIRALVGDVRAAHSCIDGLRVENSQAWSDQRKFNAAQAKVNSFAKEQRHKVTGAVTALQGDVRQLSKNVKTLSTSLGETKAKQDIDDGRISQVSRSVGAVSAVADGPSSHSPWYRHPVAAFAGLCVFLGSLVMGVLAATDGSHLAKFLVAVLHALVSGK